MPTFAIVMTVIAVAGILEIPSTTVSAYGERCHNCLLYGRFIQLSSSIRNFRKKDGII
jgi:hypothetical protein